MIHLESIYTIQYEVHIPVYIFPYDFPVISTPFIKKPIFSSDRNNLINFRHQLKIKEHTEAKEQTSVRNEIHK